MGIKMTAKKRKEERDKKVYVGGRPYIWMDGYKGTDENMCCRGLQYELNKEFTSYFEFFGFNFPLATLSVNLIGSFVLGVLSAFILFDYHLIPNHYKYALTVGFCGGFTTFSTFAFEVVEILKRGNGRCAK